MKYPQSENLKEIKEGTGQDSSTPVLAKQARLCPALIMWAPWGRCSPPAPETQVRRSLSVHRKPCPGAETRAWILPSDRVAVPYSDSPEPNQPGWHFEQPAGATLSLRSKDYCGGHSLSRRGAGLHHCSPVTEGRGTVISGEAHQLVHKLCV